MTDYSGEEAYRDVLQAFNPAVPNVGSLAREAGIRQFLDVGTGLPTRGNVHERAQTARPGARVVYVNTRAQITRFFDGLDMVAPGLVDPAGWRRPRLERESRPVLFYAGVGRKDGGAGEAVL